MYGSPMGWPSVARVCWASAHAKRERAAVGERRSSSKWGECPVVENQSLSTVGDRRWSEASSAMEATEAVEEASLRCTSCVVVLGGRGFDGGDTCCECGEIGLEFGEVGVGEMAKTTAIIHEATAVFDQFTGCDLVHLFHLCIQACGSVSDEVGGGCNVFVQVVEDSIRHRDARICRPDMLI